MLTSRERLRRCFHHEELDRPGVYVRTNFPRNDRTYGPLRQLLQERSDLKLVFNGMCVVERPPATVVDKPFSEDFKLQVTTLHTPAGDLVATHRVGLKNQPGLDDKPLIESAEDARRFLSLPMPRIAGDVSQFFELDRQVGERGIVDVSLGLNPAGQVASMCGSENFAMMSVTDRDVLHELCERQMKVTLDALEFLLAAGVGPFFSSLGQEYITPPLHGRDDFFDFNVRYDKPIFDRIHAAGGRVHVHCHGSIRTVFDGFLECDVNVLHPFEAAPMGDITPAQAKQLARGRICLEGNIQIADFYEKSPAEVRRQTEELIATCFDDRRGLIVSATASPYIPDGGGRCFEQFKAMVDAVTQWRP